MEISSLFLPETQRGKKSAQSFPAPAQRWAPGSGSQTLSFAQRKEMIGKESQRGWKKKHGKKMKKKTNPKQPQKPQTHPSSKMTGRPERSERWEGGLEQRALEKVTVFRYVVSQSYWKHHWYLGDDKSPASPPATVSLEPQCLQKIAEPHYSNYFPSSFASTLTF